MYQVALQKSVILQDSTGPYLEWHAPTGKLQVSQRQPLTLKKVVENVQEMLEVITNSQIIKAFHALPPSQKGAVTPWRLQMSLRADHEYDLMRTFCGSSIWLLMAASLKAHNPAVG